MPVLKLVACVCRPAEAENYCNGSTPYREEIHPQLRKGAGTRRFLISPVF